MIIKKTNSNLALVPLAGICLFIMLYVIAAILYPGGSDIDKASKGFSWLHNYWCELMAPYAQNGKINAARTVAITAMAVLTISLAFFWYHASRLFEEKTWGWRIIQYAGILSAASWIFLLTGEHDTVISISGSFGVIAMLTILIALYKKRSLPLFFHGLFCLLLCLVNNYVYYTGRLMDHLPVIQKITFLVFLAWFCWVVLYIKNVKPVTSHEL